MEHLTDCRARSRVSNDHSNVGIKGMLTKTRWCRADSASCAQRLSASKECSRCATTGHDTADMQCSTPVGVKGMFTRLRIVRPSTSFQCSTPVGVKGMLTGARSMVRRAVRANVLNACRRQRNAHQEASDAPTGRSACSTPVGVKGMFTSCRQRELTCVAERAQRLSASKECSPQRNRR